MNPTAPSASGWSSGNTPLPWNVVATGMPSISAKRRRAGLASARAAPWPASTIGQAAAWSSAAARSTCPRDGSSGRGTFTGSGSPCAGACSTSSGMAR